MEMNKHRENLEIVMRNSNATPTRGHRGLGYACYFCPLQYDDPADLKSHTLESHRDFKHTPANVKQTRLVKLDITSLTCKMCSKTFDQLNAFVNHLRLDHDQPFHADIKDCILPFRFDSDPFKCVICEAEFRVLKGGIEHMNIHYRNFICEVCDAGFVTSASLRSHKRLHLYGDFPCEKCPKVFNSEPKLKHHILGVHLKKNKRNKCPYCGEYFMCLIMKDNHMTQKHGVAPKVARCNACDKTFTNYNHLRVHIKSYHLLEKNYKCSKCEMKFLSRSSLEKHYVTHTGARDFKCVICQKAYGHKSSLDQHMRIHANDRRYKCGHCMMAFVQKCSLISHLHSIHNTMTPK